MSSETVRVLLERESLELIVANESVLLTGTHRIYFVNVLGFEPSNAPLGYVIKGRAIDPSLLVDVLDYLHDQGIEADLNGAARDSVLALETLTGDLHRARTVGEAIKSSPPRTFNVPKLERQLKPYQVPAVAHAVAVGNSANFSVPGSGKTTIALSAFATFHAAGEVEKLVVVGPRASFVPWEEEFQACFLRPPNCVRISGSQSRRMKLYRQAETAEMLLISYQMATNDKERLKRFLLQFKSLLVLDESHNIKRFEGGTWAPTLMSVGAYAVRRMILTGTPAPNSVTDLWSQMTFLWPRPPILGTMDEFKFQQGNEGSGSLESVRKEIFPFYWRIRKKDLGLPASRFRRIRLGLREYQKAIYTVLSAKVLSEIVKAPTDRARLRAWRTARMVRLLQAATNPALLTQNSIEFQVPPLSAAGLAVDELILNYHQFETPVKLEFAARLAQRLMEKKEKVIIWTSFIHNIRTLEHTLRAFQPRIVYGDVPKDHVEDVEFNREQMIQDFRLRDFPLLIANPSACAESVSLHKACKHAIYLDRTFNAAHYMQSLDRIHRVGMDPNHKVQYYLLLGQDTIDEVIDQRLTEKEQRMRSLLDDDITVLNLDYESKEFTEEGEEDRDFSALIEQLRGTRASQ
jgi:hypothetical protein